MARRSSRFVTVALALWLAACGGSGSGAPDELGAPESDAESVIDGGGGSPIEPGTDTGGERTSSLPSDLAVEYAEVEQCTGLRAAEPDLVIEEVRPCPQSRRMCCIASVPNFQCGLLNLSTCGAAGYYDESTRSIHLPEGCLAAFRHESVHHLLSVNGRADWKSHGAVEFRCQ
ncbi:MAG: hypothetical protein ACREQJ_13815 [Candidatus Binatia bacterium]